MPKQYMCPRCRRVLVCPAGQNFFRCACGESLKIPGNSNYSQSGVSLNFNGVSFTHPNSFFANGDSRANNSPRRTMNWSTALRGAIAEVNRSAGVDQPEETRRLRCPSCRKTIVPPRNAPIFRCPCGINLRNPATTSQTTAPPRTHNLPRTQNHPITHDPPMTTNPPFTLASSKPTYTREDSGVEKIAAALVLHSAAEQWFRVVSDDKKAVTWKNICSSDVDDHRLQSEQKCIENIAEIVARLKIEEVQERLGALKFEIDNDEELCRKTLEEAPQRLKLKPVQDLCEMLRNLGVPYDDLCDDVEYANRLVSAVMNPGLYAHGFCTIFDGNGILKWETASNTRISSSKYSPFYIVEIASLPFADKIRWFRERCKDNKKKWDDGHVKVRVRRDHLLSDSLKALSKLKQEDYHLHWRFEFSGEEGLDAGGLAREWFHSVTQKCFNVGSGLFEYSGVDNVCYQISPSSGIANENHLEFFYFLGHVMGKALFEGHNIGAHMTQPLFKHILGYPISNDDMEFVDPQIFKSMQDISNCEDASMLVLDFTNTSKVFGQLETFELKPGGANIDVTNENREEYLNLLVKHMLFDRIRDQLSMMIHGFHEVIDPVLLNVFDYAELELMLCGLPNIDVDDWEKNTKYRGEYAKSPKQHDCVTWFWECMREFTEEQRARFLQFATGTSRVPVQGFVALQGNDNQIKLFTIQSVPLKTSVFVKSHTCFNRIELPLYETKEDMKRRILQGMNFEIEGFHME